VKVTNRLHNIKEKFPQILKDSLGIITNACKKAGIERRTYYDWRKADPEFAADCDEAGEQTLDFVESKLQTLIDKENPAAIIFYMKTKGKNRGYVERIETSGKDGGPIETKVLGESQIKMFERSLQNIEEAAIARHKASKEVIDGNNSVV